MKKLISLLLVAFCFSVHAQYGKVQTNHTTSGASTSGGTAVAGFVPAAICDGGTAILGGGLSIPSTNAPVRGCPATDVSSLGYLDFYASPSVPHYAYGVTQLPATWASVKASLTFYSTVTTGSATFSIQTSCMNTASALASPTWGTAVTVTTPVAGTTSQLVSSASFANIATLSTNGCAAGSILQYRIYRAASDSLAADAYLVSVVLGVS